MQISESICAGVLPVVQKEKVRYTPLNCIETKLYAQIYHST
jgi:hypothetical protein